MIYLHRDTLRPTVTHLHFANQRCPSQGAVCFRWFSYDFSTFIQFIHCLLWLCRTAALRDVHWISPADMLTSPWMKTPWFETVKNSVVESAFEIRNNNNNTSKKTGENLCQLTVAEHLRQARAGCLHHEAQGWIRLLGDCCPLRRGVLHRNQRERVHHWWLHQVCGCPGVLHWPWQRGDEDRLPNSPVWPKHHWWPWHDVLFLDFGHRKQPGQLDSLIII